MPIYLALRLLCKWWDLSMSAKSCCACLWWTSPFHQMLKRFLDTSTPWSLLTLASILIIYLAIRMFYNSMIAKRHLASSLKDAGMKVPIWFKIWVWALCSCSLLLFGSSLFWSSTFSAHILVPRLIGLKGKRIKLFSIHRS